jgi:transposase InsO family protein
LSFVGRDLPTLAPGGHDLPLNGKVERFNRTLAAEWAYARTYTSDEARAATYGDWIHHYNHHRPHTGIGGAVPADRVHNLTGKNS